MAIREYIGARYVPKFMGTYDATQIYEALSVVDNGMGTSYICGKTTPAGTPLTDTNYWHIYGASSGAIINLQNQINVLDSDVDNIKNDYKRIVVVGDSYLLHGSNPWDRVLKDLLNVADVDFFSYGEGSSGFTHRGLYNHTFEELLTANIANITNKDTITDVFIGGGTNDFYYFIDATTLHNAIDSMITYCKSQFTNAKIWVIFNGYFAEMDDTMFSHYLQTKYWYCNALSHNVRGISANVAMKDSTYRSDTMHPNDAGSEHIARTIYNTMYASGISFIGRSTAAITTPAGLTASGTRTISVYMTAEAASLTINDITLSGTTFSVTRNVPITLGTFPCSDVQMIQNFNDFIGNIYFLVGSSQQATKCKFTFTLNNDHTVTLAIVPLIDSGVTISASQIGFLPHKYYMPIDFL